MSEIAFKDLRIENFLSIGEGSLSLDSRGLLLIQGQNDDDPSANSNGAGKSSVVDALCWVLYGTTARGKSGDAVVNRFVGKGCMVSVAFTSDAKTYTVTRYRKHPKGKNRLTLSEGTNDLTLGTDKLTQDVIESLIGCKLDVFTASIYAGQNNMPNLPAMTDKELKLLVESAAGIDLLDKAYAIARERAKAASVTEGAARCRVTALEQSVGRYQEDAALAVERSKDWVVLNKADVDRRKNALGAAVQRAKDIQGIIAATDWVALQEQIVTLQAELEAATTTPAPMPTPPTSPVYPPSPPHNPEISRLLIEATRHRRDYDRRIEAARKAKAQYDDIASIVGTPCGECGKDYCEEDLAARKASLAAEVKAAAAESTLLLREESLRKEEALAVQIIDNEGIAKHARQCEAMKAEHTVEQQRYQNELAARRKADSMIDNSAIIGALRNAQSELSKKATLTAQLEAAVVAARQAKAQLAETSAAVNPHEAAIDGAINRVHEQSEACDKAKHTLSDHMETVQQLEIAVELFSPKGIRGEILDTVTPFLNARTGHYLGALSDGQIGATWQTVGETGKGELREKFHIAAVNVNGSEDFGGMSGGEQRKVRIATAMALQDLVASRADRPIKLFIADEVDDALDVSGLERLMGILEDKARNMGSVLVISHNDLESWVPNQITVMKKCGLSHIIEL